MNSYFSKDTKLYLIVIAMAIYAMSLYGGLWWIDDDLIRGIIFLVGVLVFSIHTYSKYSIGIKNSIYIFAIYVLPFAIGFALFVYGLYYRWGSIRF